MDRLKLKEILSNYTILIVDDDELVLETIEHMFARYFKSVYSAHDGIQGINAYNKYTPDFILTDVSMPNCNGIEMARQIRLVNKDAKIIFATGHSEESYCETFKNEGFQYITKPVSLEFVFEIICNMSFELQSY